MGKIKKKAGHYREKENKKPKKNDRKVLSFEELPLEEYEKNTDVEVKITKKKVIIACIIIFCLFISMFLYFGWDNLSSCAGSTGAKSDFTVNVIGSSVDAGNISTVPGGLYYTSDSDFIYLDYKGSTVHDAQHDFARPILKTSGDKALIYDLGSMSYAVYSADGEYATAESEYKLYLADITSDGSYAFVTEAKGYNSKLSAYSADNKIKYGYSFAEYYITSMALNADATGAVVCGVSTNNGAQESVIYVLDFTKEEPVAKHVVKDFIFDCDYISQSSVCAVGNEATYVCNQSKFSKLNTISYEGMLLTAYDINSDIGNVVVSLSRSGDGRNCNIEYISTSGKIEKNIETEYAVTSIDTYKDRVTLADSTNVYLLKSDGKFIESYTAVDTCKQVCMRNTNSVYILGLGSVYSIKF